MRRFFGAPDPSDPASLLLEGGEARHAAKVLRLSVGDRVIIMSGGGEYDCALTSITDSLCSAAILDERPRSQTGIHITLAQSVIKGPAMDDSVRFAAELGAVSFIPMITARVVPSLSKVAVEGKLARWRAIAESAAKVVGSPQPCRIASPMEISQLESLQAFDLKIAFWELERTSLKSILQNASAPQSAILVIGPEGGFTGGEISVLRSLGFTTASLGDRIIRAQTAGPAALMAVIYHFSR